MIPYDSIWLYYIWLYVIIWLIWLLLIIIAHFSPLCIRLGLTCDDLKPDFVKLSARAGPPRGTVEFALDATGVKMLTTHAVFTATTLGQNCAMLIHIVPYIRTKTPCRSYQIFSVQSLYYTYQYQYVVFYVVFIFCPFPSPLLFFGESDAISRSPAVTGFEIGIFISMFLMGWLCEEQMGFHTKRQYGCAAKISQVQTTADILDMLHDSRKKMGRLTMTDHGSTTPRMQRGLLQERRVAGPRWRWRWHGWKALPTKCSSQWPLGESLQPKTLAEKIGIRCLRRIHGSLRLGGFGCGHQQTQLVEFWPFGMCFCWFSCGEWANHVNQCKERIFNDFWRETTNGFRCLESPRYN